MVSVYDFLPINSEGNFIQSVSIPNPLLSETFSFRNTKTGNLYQENCGNLLTKGCASKRMSSNTEYTGITTLVVRANKISENRFSIEVEIIEIIVNHSYV